MLTKADRTKQFIIEKSAPIFNTKGYAATSMADILKATGLTKGGIYGNFDCKDDIAVAAFDYAFELLRQALRFKIGQEKTATGKLLSIIQFYKNYTIAPPIQGGCPIMNTAVDADDNIPFLKQRAKEALTELLGSLEYILIKGVESGEFRSDLKTAEEATLFFSIIEGGVMMSKVTDNPKILNGLLDQLKNKVQNDYIN